MAGRITMAYHIGALPRTPYGPSRGNEKFRGLFTGRRKEAE